MIYIVNNSTLARFAWLSGAIFPFLFFLAWLIGLHAAHEYPVAPCCRVAVLKCILSETSISFLESCVVHMLYFTLEMGGVSFKRTDTKDGGRGLVSRDHLWGGCAFVVYQ